MRSPDVSDALSQIAMPNDAAIELLALRLIGSLGTENADGSVQLTPIWYLYHQLNGLLYIATGSRSQKIRNVQARPRATLLVDRRDPVGHRYVIASGQAEVVVGGASTQINARVRERYLTEAGEAAYGRWLEQADDATIVLRPTAWRYWALSNLEQIAADAGLPVDAIPDWFLPLD
jgi:PPOX class probable F420-dependent enzyme